LYPDQPSLDYLCVYFTPAGAFETKPLIGSFRERDSLGGPILVVDRLSEIIGLLA
jgi:hypothetical protein